MYCFITTVPVAFYWACSDDTVYYEYDKTVNFSVLDVQLRRLRLVIFITDCECVSRHFIC